MIEEGAFAPQAIRVRIGDKVVWANKDRIAHTVTASEKIFDSREIPAARTWTYVPKKPGTFEYACKYHPAMRGVLVVQ